MGRVILIILLLASPAYAFDVTFHVPDKWAEEVAGWYHYYAHPQTESKPVFCVRNMMEEMEGIVVPIITKLRYKHFSEAGITWEVKEDAK